MKSLLVGIFIVAMGGFIAGNQIARRHGIGTYLPAVNCSVGAPCMVGNVLFNNDSVYCPWWIDPELWWNQSCDGGLPPRLPVPEGLR